MPSRRTKSRNARSGTTRKRHNRNNTRCVTHKRTHRPMCKRRRTRGLHRAGGALPQAPQPINFGNAFVLKSGETWEPQNISITHTPTKNTVELFGNTFHIDKLRFYECKSEHNKYGGMSHQVPIKVLGESADWSHRVDFLDAYNKVNSIQFDNNPNEQLNGIMHRSPFLKECIMQGMLGIKYTSSSTQPVAGGFGNWATKNCVLYIERTQGPRRLVFEYESKDDEIKRIDLKDGSTILGHIYPIENRNNFGFLKKKQNRFDLYWQSNTQNLCLYAPDETENQMWMDAFYTFDLKEVSIEHPRIDILDPKGTQRKHMMDEERLRQEASEAYFSKYRDKDDNL